MSKSIIFGLIFIIGYVHGQINNSPVIGKQSIPNNPSDLFKDTKNEQLKDNDKRGASNEVKSEDIGGSIGSQSSGSQIGATQLGQKDITNSNSRKRRQVEKSKLPSALETQSSVEKLKEGDFDQKQSSRQKRQEQREHLLNEILMPYRKKRFPNANENAEQVDLKEGNVAPEGAMIPSGIPPGRAARDTHKYLSEVQMNQNHVGESLEVADKNAKLLRAVRTANDTDPGNVASKGTSTYAEVGFRPDEIGKPHSSIKADDSGSSPDIGA